MYGLTPNQSAKLVAKGRMKAIGVHWTEEEAVAIAKASPAERETLIAKLRGQGEPANKVPGKLATPEEIKAEKERVKAEKEAKKAEAKAKKEAEAKAKKEGKGSKK